MRKLRAIAGSLLLLTAAGLAHALPPGYKDDFNGCATQSPDEAARKECCLETFQDCSRVCDSVGPMESLACRMDCLEAELKCEDGRTIPIVAWPGNFGVVPGLTSDGDHLLPERGRDLVASRSAVVVEFRSTSPSTADACVALVVGCQCPTGSQERDLECRASIEGKGTACKVCQRGGSAASCKPCPDCRPELLSSQPCAVADRPAPLPPTTDQEEDQGQEPKGQEPDE